MGEWEHNVVDNVVDDDGDGDDDEDDEDENVANGDVEEDEVQDDDVWGKEKTALHISCLNGCLNPPSALSCP